jgi:hypothetical protein
VIPVRPSADRDPASPSEDNNLGKSRRSPGESECPPEGPPEVAKFERAEYIAKYNAYEIRARLKLQARPVLHSFESPPSPMVAAMNMRLLAGCVVAAIAFLYWKEDPNNELDSLGVPNGLESKLTLLDLKRRKEPRCGEGYRA